jgi:hypothetical protein
MIDKIGMNVAIICGVLLLTGCQSEKIVFPPNRDTVELFGDGRFHIGKSANVYSLYDCKTHETIAFDIRDWCKRDDLVYTLDKKGVCRLVNYRTGDKREYASIELAPPEHRIVFERLQ